MFPRRLVRPTRESIPLLNFHVKGDSTAPGCADREQTDRRTGPLRKSLTNPARIPKPPLSHVQIPFPSKIPSIPRVAYNANLSL